MTRALRFLPALLVVACSPSSTQTPHGSADDASHADSGVALVVPTPTPKKDVRYLALGDSFTIGTGATPEASFPARWAARWGDRCTPVVRNVGVNGYTTQDLIDRELPVLAEFKPHWATVAIGANDIVAGESPEVYRAHVKTIFSAVLAGGVVPDHVVVVPQPDWSLSPTASAFGTPSSIAARIATFNSVLAEEAKAIGARWVDLFPLMHTEALAKMLASDGLHPSATAYDEWGAALAKLVPSPCE